MPSEVPSTTPMESRKGLPPVTPPSGKFIAQLFVVPGVIVLVAVGCIWFVTWLVGGFFSPEQFLKDLRSSNPEVRWRRASDLAQVLKRDDVLAANPTFGLELAELLRQALRENDQAEKELASRPAPVNKGDPGFDAKNEKKHPLHDERAFIEFLIACMGNFSTPVGVPELKEIALKEDGADATTVALRRQLAVWALANVGENLKRFDKLPVEQRMATLTKLQEDVAGASPLRREWAKATLDFLAARAAQKPHVMGVDQTLARCAAADDPSLRSITALALSFWEGTAEENARMEETLLQLSEKNDGRGAPADEVTRRWARTTRRSPRPATGREIRYQAAKALALRGSDKTLRRLPVFHEMLDEDFLAKSFRIRLQTGQEVADGAIVRSIMTGALKSLAELARKQPGIDLSSLHEAIDKLAQSKDPELRLEAERTQLALIPHP